MTMIKICGITDPDLAAFTAQAGADMIGIVQYPTSKRHVKLSVAKEIALAAKEAGIIPVAVFKDATREEIISASQFMDVFTVQLHGSFPQLPDNYVRIAANAYAVKLRPELDFLLVDNAQPGSGITFDWDAFIPPRGMPWILSGGLTADNVQEGIRRFHPDGVDTSSGVEAGGAKQKELIKNFIDKVRSYE